MQAQITTDVVNSINGKAVKMLDNATASKLGDSIVSAYRQVHNLPIVGLGVVLPTSPERTKNKIKQAAFRAEHERIYEWKNSINNTIIDAFKYKLQALRVARKANDLAFRKWQVALKAGAETAANLELIYNGKHAIFLAAQQVTYTGDGTTL